MPDVIVSHPGRQHSFRLAYALQKAGLLNKLITSVYYKPDNFPYSLTRYIPHRWKSIIEELKKRYHDKLYTCNVEQFPFFELLREAAERLNISSFPLDIYTINQIHDWYVSNRLSRLKPDVVIGSETASYRTFQKARELGITTVLDVPSVHFEFINKLRADYKEFNLTFNDTNTYLKKESAKYREYKYADYIICISQFAKSTIGVDLYDKDRIFVVNLGYDNNIFKPKKSYNISKALLKIIYVGNISVRKGIKVLIKALQILNDRKIELILVGNLIDCNITSENTSINFKHIAYCNHNELAKLYQEADLFILPTYMDGWGMVLVEAMSCGTPVITTENAGSKEAITNGEDGFIVPAGDAESLADKILYFYDNRNEIERFGKKARKKAELYTWDSYGGKIKDIVDSIM